MLKGWGVATVSGLSLLTTTTLVSLTRRIRCCLKVKDVRGQTQLLLPLLAGPPLLHLLPHVCWQLPRLHTTQPQVYCLAQDHQLLLDHPLRLAVHVNAV
jgi:hypothetical protein